VKSDSHGLEMARSWGLGAGSIRCSLRYFVAIICTSLCLQATNLILFKVPMRRSAPHLHMPLQTPGPESQPMPNPTWMAHTVGVNQIVHLLKSK